jgi:DNA-binding CsgD family transcriptional regulator
VVTRPQYGRIRLKDGLPCVVWSTVGRLLGAEDGEDPQRAVQVRVRGLDGRWAVVEASRMNGAPDLLAVTVHAAGPRQILDLFCCACGLTHREHEVIELVVDGLDTRAIAKHLSISHFTVQEHLQSAFGKLGVSSRLELTTRIIAQGS